MNGLGKKKRGLCGAAFQTVKLQASYLSAAFLANIFGVPFWLFEQERTRLLDRIDNQRSSR